VEKKQSATDKRRESLFLKRKNGYDGLRAGEDERIHAFCEEYMRFLEKGKTERTCVDYVVSLVEAKGFRPYKRGETIQPGDKIYRVNRGKAIMLAVIGKHALAV
jgi:aspartyl aminopeptidase